MAKRWPFPRWFIALFVLTQVAAFHSIVTYTWDVQEGSSISVALWLTGALFSMPGGYFAGFITEGPSITGLPMGEQLVIEAVLTVIMNVLIWFGIALIAQLAYRKLKSKA